MTLPPNLLPPARRFSWPTTTSPGQHKCQQPMALLRPSADVNVGVATRKSPTPTTRTPQLAPPPKKAKVQVTPIRRRVRLKNARPSLPSEAGSRPILQNIQPPALPPIHLHQTEMPIGGPQGMTGGENCIQPLTAGAAVALASALPTSSAKYSS
ncbi:hypothetical protein B0H14DRAFT_2684083 [Mycena olivaceomarginata]|nr:hypothetical protein B0H14DRAFT_2684083 [Mycena olivaceomarginata]